MIRNCNHQIGTELKSILLFTFISVLATTGFAQSTPAGSLYLGQTPPGSTPKALQLFVNKGFFAAERITIAKSLGKPLNTAGENLDFFVSLDESFMIVTNRPALAISFRNNDGSWTNPINFGPKINFGLGSWGPWVSPDNKYLFYSTGTIPDYSDVKVYWVRIDGIIDSLKKLSTPYSILR